MPAKFILVDLNGGYHLALDETTRDRIAHEISQGQEPGTHIEQFTYSGCFDVREFAVRHAAWVGDDDPRGEGSGSGSAT